MTSPSALQPVALEPGRVRLAALERDLAARERDLMLLKRELHELQSRYLSKVGVLYSQLSELEAAIAEAEIAQGLRPPPLDEDDDAEPETPGAQEPGVSPCASRAAPSADLKRMFRGIAKAVHPDLANGDPARARRHSLMAEANRAYAERDEDRLRLILSTWERSPDSVPDDDPDAERERVSRRIAQLDERLLAIDVELKDLRSSAIARLKQRIDEAARQGWDLFGEMILQMRREISRATARLASLRAGTRR